MHTYNNKPAYSGFILLFVAIKIALNLLAIPHFGFHRDELLHLALGDHLDWGYKEVPPFIALLAKITIALFGDSVIATRIFSTIAAGALTWFTSKITAELGGGKFAIALGCLALIFSPAFAASGYLFQPVIFDQLWWVLAVYLILKYINTLSIKYLYWLGVVIGIGLLTKYTMGFFAFALIIGLLITKQRKLLYNKHILGAVLVALLIFLPNIIWQLTHHLPGITHMNALRSSQLDYITPPQFISQQLLVNGIALFVWVAGLFFLLFSPGMRKYQFIAFAYFAIFLFLLLMNGKNYYLFGAYPMLFAAGACAFETRLKKAGTILKTIVVAFFVIPNLLFLPLVLPLLSINQTLNFISYLHKKAPFMNFITTWEDHKLHPLTQDYADMFGWNEMAEKAGKVYHSLTPEQQKHTILITDNYGEAGAMYHFNQQYYLPHQVSLNSSFTLWSPKSIADIQYIIYVDDSNGDDIKRLQPYIESYQKFSQVDNSLAREKGTAIYLFTHPKPALNQVYQKERTQKLLE